MLKPRLDILPPAQQSLWPHLADLPDHFVLYGGTAIALRLGHRESVDFDFFSDVPLDEALKERLLSDVTWLVGAQVLQSDRNTLTLGVQHAGSAIKLSFFGGIRTGRVGTPERTDDAVLWVASLDDLMAHKLMVILQRSEKKDYHDIAAMIRAGVGVDRGLAAARLFFGKAFQPAESLKALTYFKDGDLGKLSDVDRGTLIAAGMAVRALPVISLRSRKLAN